LLVSHGAINGERITKCDHLITKFGAVMMMFEQRILIVDDEPSNLAMIRQVLHKQYALAFAQSGIQALEIAYQLTLSLILLDIRMPGMDGYAVCRRLKANPKSEHIPIILISSLADVGDEAQGFAVGAVDYLIKPISPLVVKTYIKNHLSLLHTNYAADT
jgi:putative two-component system response regulator